MRDDAPDELLDEIRLDGVIAMQRVLMPTRNALLVDQTSVQDAVDAVGDACQRSGALAGVARVRSGRG